MAPAGFKQLLLQRLNALPSDWDVLHLHGCSVRRAVRALRPGIFVDRESYCTLGYVARAQFAVKAGPAGWQPCQLGCCAGCLSLELPADAC